MEHFNPDQRILLSAEYLFDIKTFSEFETPFSYLPSIPEKREKIGRPKVFRLLQRGSFFQPFHGETSAFEPCSYIRIRGIDEMLLEPLLPDDENQSIFDTRHPRV